MGLHVRCGPEAGQNFGQDEESVRQARNDSRRGHGLGVTGVIALTLEDIRLGAQDPVAIDPVVEEPVRVDLVRPRAVIGAQTHIH